MLSHAAMLVKLVAQVRKVKDCGAYDLDNEESDGKYKTWQSKRLKNMIEEADIIIASTQVFSKEPAKKDVS